MSDGQLAVVGPSLVGKTCLVQRFLTGSFSLRESTIGAEFRVRTIAVNGIPAFIRIADCSGNPAYASIADRYVRTAPVVMVVYDLTRPETLDAALAIVAGVREWSGSALVSGRNCKEFVLIGMKSDATESTLKGESAAAKAGRVAAAASGMLFFTVSARTGVGVNEAFVSAVSSYATRCHITLSGPTATVPVQGTSAASSQSRTQKPNRAHSGSVGSSGVNVSIFGNSKSAGGGTGHQGSSAASRNKPQPLPRQTSEGSADPPSSMSTSFTSSLRALRGSKRGHGKLGPPIVATDLQALELSGSGLPLPFDCVEAAPHTVGFAGVLTKKGHVIPSWRVRLFVLRDTLLYYYDQKDVSAPKGVIVLGATTTVEEWPDDGVHKFCLRLSVSNAYTRNEDYVISAPDDASRRSWIAAIGAAIAYAAEGHHIVDGPLSNPPSPTASPRRPSVDADGVSDADKRHAAIVLDGREHVRIVVEGDAVGFAPCTSGPSLHFGGPRVRWYARGATSLVAHLVHRGPDDKELKILLASEGGTPVRIALWAVPPKPPKRGMLPRSSSSVDEMASVGGGGSAAGTDCAPGTALNAIADYLEESGVRIAFPRVGRDGKISAANVGGVPDHQSVSCVRLMLECAHSAYAAACQALYTQPIPELVVDLASAMTAGKAMTQFSASGCSLTERDVRALLYPLRFYADARDVSLRRCRIGSTALALAVRTIAAECHGVRSLDLSGIGDALCAPEALAAIGGLAQLARVQTLSVANNGLTDGDVAPLLAAVAGRAHPTLDVLDLSGNLVGDGSCHAISRLFYSPGCPTSLILEANKITSAGCSAIVDLLREAVGEDATAHDVGSASHAQAHSHAEADARSHHHHHHHKQQHQQHSHVPPAHGDGSLRRASTASNSSAAPLPGASGGAAGVRNMRRFNLDGNGVLPTHRRTIARILRFHGALSRSAGSASAEDGGEQVAGESVGSSTTALQSSLEALSMSTLSAAHDVAAEVDLELAVVSLDRDGCCVYTQQWQARALGGAVPPGRRFDALAMDGAAAVLDIDPSASLSVCVGGGEVHVIAHAGDNGGVLRVQCDPNACSFSLWRSHVNARSNGDVSGGPTPLVTSFAVQERDFADVCSSLAMYASSMATRSARTPDAIEADFLRALAQVVPVLRNASNINNGALQFLAMLCSAASVPSEIASAASRSCDAFFDAVLLCALHGDGDAHDATTTERLPHAADAPLFEVLRSIVAAAAAICTLSRVAAPQHEQRAAALRMVLAEIGAHFACAVDGAAAIATECPVVLTFDSVVVLRAVTGLLVECAAASAAAIEGGVPSPGVAELVSRLGAVASNASKVVTAIVAGLHLTDPTPIASEATSSRVDTFAALTAKCSQAVAAGVAGGNGARLVHDASAWVFLPRGCVIAHLASHGATLAGSWMVSILSRPSRAALLHATGIRTLSSSSQPTAAGVVTPGPSICTVGGRGDEVDPSQYYADDGVPVMADTFSLVCHVVGSAHTCAAIALSKRSDALARATMRHVALAALIALSRGADRDADSDGQTVLSVVLRLHACMRRRADELRSKGGDEWRVSVVVDALPVLAAIVGEAVVRSNSVSNRISIEI